MLPNNVYALGHNIISELEEVRYLGIKYGQEARIMGKPLAGFQECSAKLESISKQIEDLEKGLREAYLLTFK